MDVGTLIYTWINGRQVGSDIFGNRYYEHKTRSNSDGRLKRWVIYRGMVEPSKVPPEWHAWLHYSIEEVPSESDKNSFSWQKLHLPNLTGTRYAYRPPGHVLQGGKREKATGDYEPWIPS